MSSAALDDLALDQAYTFTEDVRNALRSGPSATTTATPTTPDAPTLSASAGDRRLTLSFPADAQATNYEYRIRAADADAWADDDAGWVTRAPASTSSPWVVTGLTNGTTYVVQVRIVAPGVTSAPSNEATGTPTAPPAPAPAPAPAPSPAPDPAPAPAPEPIRDDAGQRPAPGQAAGTVDGVPVPVTVAPSGSGGVAVSGDGFLLEVEPADAPGTGDDPDAPGGGAPGGDDGTGTDDGTDPDTGTDPDDGSPDAEDDGGVGARADLTFTRGQSAQVRVSGFAPSSPVKLWLLSEPRLLGEFETTADGALEALTDVIGDDVDACLHTLHAQGVLPGGQQVALSLGVWIDADPYPFADVGEASVHRRAIGCLFDRAIVRGVGGQRFDPEGQATRGQLASVFAAWFDLAASAGTVTSFPDVTGSTHEAAIGALLEAGVVEGLPDGSFGTQQPMSRGQFASVLAGLLELELAATSSFSDAGAAHGGAIGALEDAGMVAGYSDGTFRPHEPIGRAQAASMIMRAILRTE